MRVAPRRQSRKIGLGPLSPCSRPHAMLHLQRFSASYEYPVYFGAGVFSPENPALVQALSRREPARLHRLAVVVEERVATLWPSLLGDIQGYARCHEGRLLLAGEPRVEPGGEECKNAPEAVLRLAEWFDALGMDRQSFVVIVGGGAFQDMVGYAAATTHRGLRVVRVPTTVLSQNDSGVGVKNGVNAFGKKNFFGVFAPPFAVLNDPRFLSTLDPRDKASGMAEAVKVALIKDAPFFEWMERAAPALAGFETPAVSELIQRCAVLHLDHIASAGDPFELGSSRPLDFGHWAAHKLETLSGFELRHGEAVAVGIALDTLHSVEIGMLAPLEAERVLALLERMGLPTWDPRLDASHASASDASGSTRLVLSGIREFREHLGGDLTIMMLEAIGRGREVRTLDEAVVGRAIDKLRERAVERRRAGGEAGARTSDAGEAAE
jgi:3-dehydroquinate synthase